MIFKVVFIFCRLNGFVVLVMSRILIFIFVMELVVFKISDKKKVVRVFSCIVNIFIIFFLLLILKIVNFVIDVKVGVLFMISVVELFDLWRVGVVLDIVFEFLELKYGVCFILKYYNYIGFCLKEIVIGYFLEFYYVYNVKVIIGLVCLVILVVVGRFV